jgi:hypothetical protein
MVLAPCGRTAIGAGAGPVDFDGGVKNLAVFGEFALDCLRHGGGIGTGGKGELQRCHAATG